MLFAEHVVSISDALGKATSAVQSAEKALIDPSRGLVRQAEQLRAFGITPKRSMPKKLASDDEGAKPADLSVPSQLDDNDGETRIGADEGA